MSGSVAQLDEIPVSDELLRRLREAGGLATRELLQPHLLSSFMGQL